MAPARLDGPGAVGLGRDPRRLADRARRGPRRARLLHDDARGRRARASTASSRRRSPRPIPGESSRGAAAADVRHPGWAAIATATRTSRRQSTARGARADARDLPALPRGPRGRAGRPRVAVARGWSASPAELEPLLAAGAERFPELAETLAQRNPEEPYRRAVLVRAPSACARRAAASPGATPTRTSCSPTCAPSSATLRSEHGALRRRRGDLRDVIRQVEVFGFHFARLDIREHAGRHRDALAEILAHAARAARATPTLAGGRARRAAARARSRTRRPLIPADLGRLLASPRARSIETFRIAARACSTGEHAGAMQTYIVSGTTGPPTCSRCCC